MADKKPSQQNTRTATVWAILTILLFFVLGSQLAGMGGGKQDQKVTDQLITSDFVTAVNDGRVTSVTYDAGNDAVSGTYYPATTAGGAAASAFNTGFDALSAALGTLQDTSGMPLASHVQTEGISTVNLGEERNFTATWVGRDSLGELMSAHPEIKYEVSLPNSIVSTLLSYFPMILLTGFFIWMFYQMSKANNSQMGFGRTKSKIANEERPDVHFTDVAGVDEAVEEMQEIKDFLANPAKYQELGAKIPRGCLLVGPPGTGKTLLARAVAGEAGVPFFSISGSDFVEMFVGVGASRVRDLFKQAKEASPAIIFIDEIDAVGRQRGAGLGGGHDEREQTLNQLLVEMDGFNANDSVVLVAATNRADVLDPALLRPGRFDRQIVVDVPDVKGRLKILQVHAKGKPIAQDVDLDKIAKLTPGFTGADLANLLNESALLTARRGKKVIAMDEVQDSMERVIAGPERKGRVLDELTRHTIAYHESGHALVGHTLPLADPVHKISIVSRGRALGYTLSIPKEDKVLNGRNEMMQELAVFLGGRVAEEIFCDDITTGASNDLERATKMARQMVTQYGMSTELGTQIFGQPNHEVFLGRDYGNTQDYSEETARRIDAEVARIMKQAHDVAYQILSERRDQMDLMASVLLERETIDGEACQALLDNKWVEYLQHEQSDEGRAQRERAANTVVDAPEAKAVQSPEGEQPEAPQPEAAESRLGFCPSCGAKLEVPAKFCPNCGAPLPESPQRADGQGAQQSPMDDTRL
ncbi:ATP-dependent zinc metalloprotease FtsH [Curtanaerobium respiraculi]|uniref:ATP-dependent zinc metalloprotease FtsH n=1 Tax=Curtanaerobium respiraculi TaxID=2949669 RepID=UPI0024B397A8|nr:ATP-dependent zinc metalloprotease FtsH [Curtanaerobium respiraculi]